MCSSDLEKLQKKTEKIKEKKDKEAKKPEKIKENVVSELKDALSGNDKPKKK